MLEKLKTMNTLGLLEYGMFLMNNNLGIHKSEYDVQETDEKYILSLRVPGLREQDIDVKVRNDRKLMIKSKRDTKFTSEFSYVFLIPTRIKKENTYATVEDGVLEVHLFKAEADEFKVKMR